MKEGRMKGQAFVTLPSEEKAKKALRDAHGYILQGKPMVIVSLFMEFAWNKQRFPTQAFWDHNVERVETTDTEREWLVTNTTREGP